MKKTSFIMVILALLWFAFSCDSSSNDAEEVQQIIQHTVHLQIKFETGACDPTILREIKSIGARLYNQSKSVMYRINCKDTQGKINNENDLVNLLKGAAFSEITITDKNEPWYLIIVGSTRACEDIKTEIVLCGGFWDKSSLPLFSESENTLQVGIACKSPNDLNPNSPLSQYISKCSQYFIMEY